MPSKPFPLTTDAKIDEILEHLRRIDKRDRVRMVGGFIRSIIALIPIAFLLWSVWYFTNHGGDLMKMVADQAASSAAKYTQSQSSGMFDQLMKQYAAPKK